MKRSLTLLSCGAALVAFGCGDQGAGLTPPDASFRPSQGGGGQASCLADAESQVGDVFAGSFKNDFKDLLDTDGDGKISEADAFQAAIRISIAYDPLEADFWSNDIAYGDAALADWTSSLGNRTTPADAAELVRLIFACAVLGDDGDVTTTGDQGWNDAALDWTGFDFTDGGQFEDDITKALTQTGTDDTDYSDFGAFAVRNPLVDRSYAVTSPDDPNGSPPEPYWGVEPQAGEDWSDVFGEDALGPTQQVLVYGFADEPLLTGQATREGGEYSWNALPSFSRFESDIVVGTCQASVQSLGDGPGQANTVRILRQLSVTTTAGSPTFCDPDFRTTGSSSSFFSSLASAVGRLFTPAELHAGAAASPGGKGGLAINWSTFSVAGIGEVELLIRNQPCKDQTETTDTNAPNYLDFEPCDDPTANLIVRAQTVPAFGFAYDEGLAIEDICLAVNAVDNNGQDKGLFGFAADYPPDCPQVGDEPTAVTRDDASDNAGEAIFDPMYIVGRGGFRLRVSAPGIADFAPVDSDGFNVRPEN